MSSPLKLSTLQGMRDEQQRQTDLVHDYLDHLCAPLIGILPYSRRREVRLEAEAHLYALIEEQREAGMDLLKATETALSQYGAPYRLGQAIADGWSRSEGSRTKPAKYMRLAALRAFACFSTPTAVSFLLVENHALSGAGMMIPAWIAAWLLISPVLAGASCGWIVPARSAQAVFVSSLFLLLGGLVIGLVLLPLPHGLYLTLFQLLYGLPIGALTASLVESLRRHLLRISFRPVVTR